MDSLLMQWKIRTHNAWFQVHVDSTWYVLSRARFAEERVVRFVTVINDHWFITDQVTIRMDPVLQAVQFPAGIAHLYSSLTNVDRYAFPLKEDFF